METKSKDNSLKRLFQPRNVLIYKISPNISFFVEGFLRQGFNLENLYLVNSQADNFLGIKCYKSIDEIPIESFDLLILSVRRDLLIESLREILSKKIIRFIHIFTAGTGEFD